MAGDNTIILIFEKPNSEGGHNLAVVGCFGVKTIQEIEPGKPKYAQFCSQSELTFDEEIAKARSYQGAMIHIGNYTGLGSLIDSANCEFVFSTDVFKYKWQLDQAKRIFKKLFWKKRYRQHCLVLGRAT